MKLNLIKYAAIITVNGKGRAYLNQFKIIQEPTCLCETAEQTTVHLIFE